MGVKKGLGAQKLNVDFSKIEQEAQREDELREKAALRKHQPPEELTEKQRAETIASLDMAYNDLIAKHKQTEEEIKNLDPVKAEQFERLGLGFQAVKSTRSGVSHSASSEMTTMEQINPPSKYESLEKELLLYDFGWGSSRSFTRYNVNPFEFKLEKEKKPQVINDIPTIEEIGPR